MAGKAGDSSLVFMLLLLKQVICHITGPSQLTHFVGDNAHFRWNNTNNNPIIFSATWGIKKGDIADPQFISVDILSNKVYVNSDLEPDLMNRLSFDGDLNKGRAWFTLKNVTVNDINEYLASISEDGQRVLAYTVVLTVKEREEKDKQNELDDITTKEPDTNQVVHTLFPQTVNTATKETQVNVSADPEEAANSMSEVVVISIAVLIAVLFLVVIAMVITFKMKRIKLDRRDTESSENKLMMNRIKLDSNGTESSEKKLMMNRIKLDSNGTESSEKKLMMNRIKLDSNGTESSEKKSMV